VFSEAGLEFDEYAVFIPWLPRAAFFGLLAQADLCLDTIGFSGFNTVMQAIECGLPIVTREGRFLRGRFGSGVLKRIGLSELVATSDSAFADLAIRLGNDPAYRSDIRQRIETSRDTLFDDVAPVRALEALLLEVTRRKKLREPVSESDLRALSGSPATDDV
jgi:predicted O-linked N-acetylglucosamine transferase (SPINDLY family)